jgi:methylated-DNA-protein-cysteine methyltransferase-like protein
LGKQQNLMVMSENSDFFSRVYEVVKQIPAGRVTTYGAVAAAIGAPGAARMVGWAMNKAFSHTEAIPAHRVVNRNGMLTGKHAFPGTHTMQELLESEGISVKNNKVMDFQKKFWAPVQSDFSK